MKGVIRKEFNRKYIRNKKVVMNIFQYIHYYFFAYSIFMLFTSLLIGFFTSRGSFLAHTSFSF